MDYPFIPRAASTRLEKIFKNFSCLVLTGARQVGKSTLLENLFPQIPKFVFDPIVDIHNARKEPELFLRNNPPPLILDEIQYAPELVPVIKRKVDELKKPSLYILTGSQQWSVLKQITESLAGRAIIAHLEGFSLGELAQPQAKGSWLERWLDNPDQFIQEKSERLKLPFSLLEQLWRGFLPETQFLELDLIPNYQSSYQKTYIEKDIRLLADISDVQEFNRFIKLAAALVAQEMNYSQLGREIGITPQTAKRWLNLLISTFEWFEIPAFSNNPLKKTSLKPKGYFSDTGQICYSQMISSKNGIMAHPLWGAIFENAVIAEIRKQCFYMSTPPSLYHWRVHSGAEVDLLLERDGKFFPIEVKTTARPTKKDSFGLNAFRENHANLNVQKGLIIAPCEDKYAVTELDWVIPWDVN